MNATSSKPRPYRGNDHLWSTITTDAGAIAVLPLRNGNIMFDIAWSNHLPANRPEGEHGSRVLDIGQGVTIRAHGHVVCDASGHWYVRAEYTSIAGMGVNITDKRQSRAFDLISRLVGEWARTHEGDIAQADDIDRNNAARTLEENIARHENALAILRENLTACEEGESFTQYPDLPTKGR